MWQIFVALDYPLECGFPYHIQIAEEVNVKKLVTVRPIEAFKLKYRSHQEGILA
jgi:hypothetical protein